MKTLKNILLAFVLIVSVQSCKKMDGWQEDLLSADRRQTLFSISYGSYSRNRMDIALPKNRSTNTPVVIMIHGGAWVMGDKSYFSKDIQDFADAGIACATIDYRFASDRNNFHHDDLVADIRKALDFIASKSDEWQVSPNRFGLIGHSAGGHLALSTAYSKNSDHRIKAVVSWAGLIDLTDHDQLAITGADQLFRAYLGLGLETPADSSEYRRASPYYMVNSSSVPTLLLHGTEDPGVPYSTAQKLDRKLTELSVVHELHTMQGAYHIWTGEHHSEARSATLEWFQAKL